MKRFSFSFEEQFESKKQADGILEASCPHFIKGGTIAVVIIAVFELLMILRVVFFGIGSRNRNIEYSCMYGFLLSSSIILLVLINIFSKNIQKYKRHLYLLQIIYAIILIIWATAITLLDGKYHDGNYDVVVYMTILLVTPLIVFVNPLVIILPQIIADVIVVTEIYRSGQSAGDVINFTVYAVLSMMACYAFQKTKRTLYIKQYQLKEQAIRDPLTGIFNRQQLREDGERIWAQSIGNKKIVSVIMADIDYFKDINDSYGHLMGDKCIQTVASVFQSVCNKSEYSCYRYGGEEFVMILENTDNYSASLKVEEIMLHLKTELEKIGINLTLSYGVYSDYPTENNNLEQYLTYADRLLYESKENGRNRYTSDR